MKNTLINNLKLLFLIAVCSFTHHISLGQSSHRLGNDTVCQGQTGVIYSVDVITNATGYIWTLPSGATIIAGTNTNSITVDFSTIAASGNITVQGSNGCGTGKVSENFLVTVIPTPVAIANSNSPICAGSAINLTAQTVAGGTYLWTGTNEYLSLIQNPVILSASVANAGIYSLTVSTDGCTSAPSTVTVVVNNCGFDFNIPEGFSPNADGINDVLVIKGIEHYPDNTIVIFNRWGDKVFEAKPYQNTWNGKSTIGLKVGGDELPIATYFYLLDLGDGSAIIKGNIYLNR